MNEHIKIEIEGDFIDSFVYSGVLFLVNSDLILSTYSWDGLLQKAISEFNMLICRRITNYSKGILSTLPVEYKKTYSISSDSLSSFKLCSKELNVWPSDINIYKNRFYIASELGVDTLDFEWDGGFVSKFASTNRIFDEMSFKLATNSHYRLAVAAGKSGVLSMVPDIKYIKRTDIRQLVDFSSIDCQWQGNHLIANTEKGNLTASYLNIPSDSDFDGTKKEYWEKVKVIKKTAPKIDIYNKIHDSNIMSSWFVGDNVFKLTEEKKLYRVDLKDQNDIKEVDLKHNISTLKYFQAKSSTFGTIMETGDCLSLISDKGSYTIDDDFANWRLFPKSKDYLNHLHIIKDEHLSVMLFDNLSSKKYGYCQNKQGD